MDAIRIQKRHEENGTLSSPVEGSVMNSIIAFIIGLLGAIIYRFRGAATPLKRYLPRPISQIVFSLPYAYVAFLSGGFWVSFFCLLLTLAFVCTGHGNGHDLGSADRGEDETLEILVKWLYGKIPEYWYDVILMLVLGVCITIPCGLAAGSMLIALSGSLKAPAYMIGHWVYNNSPKVSKIDSSGNGYKGVKYLPHHLDHATAIGEFVTGLLLWSSLCLLV